MTAPPPTLSGSVNLMPTGPSSQVARLAAEAEALGYSRCWVYDEGLVTRDVYVTLTAIAAATETMLIGPGITNPFTRHPGVTANAIASLDELSGGRAFLGLGAGGGLTLGPLAIERRHPLAAVEEAVQVARRLWARGLDDDRGSAVLSRDAGHPVARTGIEVHLAGRGPKMIELAGRVADGFYLSYIHKDFIGPTVESLRAASTRPLTVTYSTRIVVDDAGFEAARRDLTFRLPDTPRAVHERLGLTTGDADALRAALMAGGPPAAASLVRDDWVTPFVIAGSRADCANELGALARANRLDEFLVPIDDLEDAPVQLAQAMAIIDAAR